jgi:hypothetical protein
MPFEPTAFSIAEGKPVPEAAHLEWSRWARCQSSVSLALVPPLPGIYALAEEVISEGESPLVGHRRMIAVFEVDASDDLARDLHGLFAPGSPLRARLADGRCFVRYAVVPVRTQRDAAATALRHWLASTSEAASAVTDGFTASSPSSAHQEDREEGVVSKAPALPEGF